MPRTSTWKAVERRVADKLNGQRVGNRGLATEDVSHPVFSIEVKHRKEMPKLILDGMEQCRRNAPNDKTPLLVLHAASSRRYYAVIDIDDLMALLASTQ